MQTLDSAPGSEVHPRAAVYGPGDLIAGKYRLLRKLEEGGMGTVWVAHHTALDVQVALKIMLPHPGSTDAGERLIFEARLAARLDHPGVVRVLDAGRTQRADAFLVMELLDGETLADTLARSDRLDVMTAVQTLLPIAGAMSAMHGKGMLHRDIKPENIFLARDDTGRIKPKIIDLGIAKTAAAPPERRLTERGVVLGTPCYMAPEQLKGMELDARADVWALSVVVYETITGALPFGDELKTPIAVSSGAPPRALAEHGIAEDELWAILKRGLAPRDERWPSMIELGRALARWLWKRAETRDITGVSLLGTWLDEGDLRPMSAPPPRFAWPPRGSPTCWRLRRAWRAPRRKRKQATQMRLRARRASLCERPFRERRYRSPMRRSPWRGPPAPLLVRRAARAR